MGSQAIGRLQKMAFAPIIVLTMHELESFSSLYYSPFPSYHFPFLPGKVFIDSVDTDICLVMFIHDSFIVHEWTKGLLICQKYCFAYINGKVF